MSQLRNDEPIKQQAHRILDELKAGIYHDRKIVDWALAVLGEPVA